MKVVIFTQRQRKTPAQLTAMQAFMSTSASTKR